MAFSVSDYQDLLALFRAHPEWRAEFTREVLDEEFHRLPALVLQNSADIRQLREVVAQNSADIRELREIVAQNSADIRELKEVVAQNSAAIRELAISVESLVLESRAARNDLSKLKGDNLEFWFRAHPQSVAMGRLRKIRLVDINDLVDFTEVVESGTLSKAQARGLADLDLLIGGREGRGDESRDAFLAVEVSETIDAYDVTRASERAETLRTLGFNAYGVVAGRGIGDSASGLAERLGVEVYERQSA
ncbi:MAG: hypothetical protein ACKVT1_10825 [Dehalococcoidia bacterium]